MRRIITSLLILCAIGYGQAQEDIDTTYISPKNFLLDEIFVSANRWEQNLREVSNRISKVGQTAIRFQNPQTAADMLGISNQVFIQKSQLGGGSPMIRGFATNRVLMVIDGVRMNNAIFRSGNLQNVISLDPNAIEDSEVIFGPGSVIYGSDAIGGVMDFHTLKPKLSKNGNLTLNGNGVARFSSANLERTGHFDFNIGLKKWAFLTSITHADYGDLFMGDNGPVVYTRPDYQVMQNGTDLIVTNPHPNEQIGSAYSQFNMMQKVRFRPAEAIEINYSFHHSKTSNYGRYDRLILRRNDGSLANGDWFYGPQKWQMHSLSTQFNKKTALTDQARFIAGYQDYSESRHNRAFGSSRLNNRFENVKALSFNFDLEKKLNENVVVFYGAEWIDNIVSSTAFQNNISTGEVTPISTRYPDGSTWRSFAAYMSMKMTLGDRWIMNISNRFTQVVAESIFDTTFFNFPFSEARINNKAVNGSIGFVFNPVPGWKAYTNLSTGFRAPNVDDVGKVFDSEPGNVIIPNPNLGPEQAYNMELGATGNVLENLTVDASMFYTSIDNAIARGFSNFNGQDSIVFDGMLSRVLALQNISEIYVYGIQLGVNWRISDKFRLTSNINLQRGKEKDVETGRNFSPTHVAPTFGSTHLLYAIGKLRIDIYMNYNGKISFNNLALSERGDAHLYAMDSNGNPYTPSWATLNYKSSFKMSKIFTLDVGFENILDKRYRPYSSGISAPGRNAILALRASF